MKPIAELYWAETSEAHLWQAHHVTPDEVEEVVFGVPGEEPTYRMIREGDYYLVFGETGSGRLLTIVGEFIEGNRSRPFGARDTDLAEKHGYRRG